MGMGFLNDDRIKKRNTIHFQLEIISQDSQDQSIDPLNPAATRPPRSPPTNRAQTLRSTVNSIATPAVMPTTYKLFSAEHSSPHE